MNEAYQVPKRQVPVRLRLAGLPPIDLSLYLADCAARHAGHECPSDLLNGGDDFIPATDLQGRLRVFRRAAVMVLSVAAELEKEGDDEDSGGADEQLTTVTVELSLEDGSRVEGELTYWRPEGQRRLQDYLNSAERFIPVRTDGLVHLVNRERIVSLSEIER